MADRAMKMDPTKVKKKLPGPVTGGYNRKTEAS